MQILSPNNLVSKLAISTLPKYLQNSTLFFSEEILLNSVNSSDNLVLVPTNQLLIYPHLYVSRRFGVSFEGDFSNAYIYYSKSDDVVKDVYLKGEYASVEKMIAKIVLSEFYDLDVNIIEINELNEQTQNYILVGDENFTESNIFKGISLGSQVVDLLELPYVNYVLVSRDEKSIREFNKSADDISDFIDLGFVENCIKTDKVSEYIKNNLASLVTKFNENDLQGIEELIRLPYYHQIIDDIVEVRFI